MGMSFFISCQEEGLVVNGNDVSYINFNKDITKDTTRICFEFYPMEEGMDVKIAEVPIEVAISGKVQDKDLEFTIGIDESLSTYPASQCILPEKCIFKNGQLLDTIYVKLKNSDDLKTATKYVALKINAGGEVSDVLFDGKDKVKLRKYSLQLKYMVEEINAGRDPDDPLRDETGVIIEIPVVG